MLKKFLATSIALAIATFASAQTMNFTVSNITSDPTNGNFQGSGFHHGVDKFTLDFLVSNVNTADDWTAGGVVATALANTHWWYASSDPNALPTAPGTASPAKFSTFVNNPRSQFTNGRFTSATSFAGSYNPAGTTPIHSSTVFNVAWLESPPVSTSLDTNAAVLRLTLDTSGTTFTSIRVGSVTTVVNGDPNNPPPASPQAGETTIAKVIVATATTLNGGTLTLGDFYVYGSVPEPASLGLLALGGLLGFRRR